MNIGEANAVNIVVAHVLDDTSQEPERLREACLILAASANKALAAGLRPEDIEKGWPA
jgi:hypothetical protein